MIQVAIDEKNLEEVFSNLKVIKDLRDIYEKDGNEVLYDRFLAEFVGIYGTLTLLGLDDKWSEWQIKHLDE
jgi:predicted regulator of amino acid metabolism with ACT domain